MGSLLGKTYLFIILLGVRIQAGQWNLDTSDFEALRQIQRDLGVSLRHSKPCNSAGIFCENQVSGESLAIIRVTRIVFQSRGLAGFLSPAIGQLSELRELSLPKNDLVDRIPSEIVDCRKLEILNLQNNKFSGRIPVGIASLMSLRSLDLSSNRFSGDLQFLQNFQKLEHLSLADNLFTGKVPPSLHSLGNLRFLNLSGNNLQGPVRSRVEYPKNILLKRYIFAENLQKTSTSAAIPPSPSSTRCYNISSPSPAPTPPKLPNMKTNIIGWIFGFLSGTFAGNFSGLICLLLYRICTRFREKGESLRIRIFKPLIRASDLAFLKEEDEVSSLEIIGRGGCGEVYKAELPNGMLIAIKKIIQLESEGASLSVEDSRLLNRKLRQIRSEIKTVGLMRHGNILPLLAHVTRLDCHYLIYEFMKNGSLQEVLNEVSQGTRELEWPIRYKVALGVARGIDYLHNLSPRIIHRDIKPGNILLGNNLEARITDFGLAMKVADTNTNLKSTYAMGTMGFIAPEYHQTLRFTDKCDIYSYGVLLAILVMGKFPSDRFFQTTNERSLVKWLWTVINSEDQKRAIDPNLLGNGFEPQMLQVLDVACFCTREDPKRRPTSNQIVYMLSHIKL